MHQIELGKGVRVAARPLDQVDLVVWTMGHVGLLFHSSFFSFSRHRPYKRILPGKRRKKTGKLFQVSGNLLSWIATKRVNRTTMSEEYLIMGEKIPVIVKKRTFLSSVAFGLSSLAITFVICCTVLIMYGMHFAGERTDRVISVAQSAIQGLPALQESLPPAMGDMLNDHRQPDYSQDLAITAQLIVQPGSNGATRTAVEVVNKGKEVVSLLALRIIVVDKNGQLLSEMQEWAATPFAAENAWRGPIMPGSRRYFVCRRGSLRGINSTDHLKAEVEINELRIWNGPGPHAASERAVPTTTAVIAAPEI